MREQDRETRSPDPFPPGTPQPAIRAFQAAGYERFDDIAGASESALLQLHGVGPKAIRILKEELTRRNLPPLVP
jgi:hypothetical protein